MQARERVYSIDNLRAVMMWLGIVLHAAGLHLVGPSTLPWHDSERHVVANAMVAVIHAFRMPVFFIVAGFFVGLLVERRGVAGMLLNRLRRIGLPLLIFWPILFAVCVRLLMLYAEKRGTRVDGMLDLRVLPVLADGTRIQTFHLWFLELLMGLIIVAAAGLTVAAALPGRVRERVAATAEWCVTQWWAFVPVSMLLAWVSRRHPLGILAASGQFLPAVEEWAFYGVFFSLGLLLYRARQRMFAQYEARCWRFALGGVATFLLVAVMQRALVRLPNLSPQAWFWIGVPYNATTWLWTCAVVGVFLRYLNQQNAALRYVSDSAYWVYLVHLPLLVAVEFLALDRPIHAGLKMLVSITVTTAASVGSYHLLVRGTPLGRLLGETGRSG